jgi:hypothetical protein
MMTDRKRLENAGVPAQAAGTLARLVAQKWDSETGELEPIGLVNAGLSAAIACDLIADISCGRAHGHQLSVMTGWPATAGEELDAILQEHVAAREARISKTFRPQTWCRPPVVPPSPEPSQQERVRSIIARIGPPPPALCDQYSDVRWAYLRPDIRSLLIAQHGGRVA